MNEWKALNLVVRYSHHTRTIKALGQEIGEHLESCKGVDGKRQDPYSARPTDHKARDKSTHLWGWYNDPVDQYDDGEAIYEVIDAGKAIVCPHCYAANLAIQARKDHRKKLGAVKAAMTRGGAA